MNPRMSCSLCRGLFLTMACLLGCEEPVTKPISPTPSIFIPLGRSVAKIENLEWPRKPADGSLVEFAGIENETHLTVQFPDESTWQISSQMTFINQADGIVTSIDITPLGKLVSFDEAVHNIELHLNDLGSELDQATRSKLAAWKQSPPAHDLTVRRSLKSTITDHVEIFAEIRPGRDGWYLSYLIYIQENMSNS